MQQEIVHFFEGKIVVTGGYNYNDRDLKSVEAYDYYENKWTYLHDMNEKSLDLCYTFDMNSNTWNKVADLNVARNFAACTVFEGKIVVTGGVYNWNELKSVEAYDYYENKWTYLPDMIEERFYHAAASMGNKQFVIGGDINTNCEVFDSSSRKFTNIHSEICSDLESLYFYGFGIGNNVVIFQEDLTEITVVKTAIYLYDVDNLKWSNVQCYFTKKILESRFVKYYIQFYDTIRILKNNNKDIVEHNFILLQLNF